MTDFVKVFDDSFARVVGVDVPQGDFFARFYQEFTAADRRVAQAFARTDMARQQSMIKKSFYYMVNFYVTQESSDYLQRIAELHGSGAMGIEPALYDIWLETLLRVLADSDPGFTREVELAWRVVLAPGIAYMKFAY